MWATTCRRIIVFVKNTAHYAVTLDGTWRVSRVCWCCLCNISSPAIPAAMWSEAGCFANNTFHVLSMFGKFWVQSWRWCGGFSNEQYSTGNKLILAPPLGMPEWVWPEDAPKTYRIWKVFVSETANSRPYLRLNYIITLKWLQKEQNLHNARTQGLSS